MVDIKPKLSRKRTKTKEAKPRLKVAKRRALIKTVKLRRRISMIGSTILTITS
tara:strand:+ start:274 stop:432 length:159 start_codon:yes stop_codon:yes gene_type:complete